MICGAMIFCVGYGLRNGRDMLIISSQPKADYSVFVLNRDDRTGGAGTWPGFFHLSSRSPAGAADLSVARAGISNAFHYQTKERANKAR